MDTKLDKQLDNLSQKVMSRVEMEQPSVDFTLAVMSQVEQIKSPATTTYTPLISSRMWLLIGLSVFGACLVMYFSSSNVDSSWLSEILVETFSTLSIPKPVEHITLSNTVFYGVVLFSIMFCVQLSLLKTYFDKRFSFNP